MTFLVFALLSLAALIKSADVFVDQASSLANKLKVNDFLIGFTVVAFGTSLPELVSTVFSSLDGHNELVVSNIIGSNIANLCLIFGLIAVFNTYRIHKRDVEVNIPLNLAAMMVFWIFSVWSGFKISWPFGISLILIFLTLIILSKDYNYVQSNIPKKYSKFRLWLLLISLAVLVGSGKLLIESIISLAIELNIAETILGYFLLAIGTSLPELVTTWIAVRKKDGELGMGNILGSNLFNLLLIWGVTSFINPIETGRFAGDLIFLTLAILAVCLFAVSGKKYSFSKREGFGLLALYSLFAIFQVIKLN